MLFRSLAVGLTWEVFSGLFAWLGDDTAAEHRRDSIEAMQLVELTPSSGAETNKHRTSAGAGTPPPAPATQTSSPIETSTLTPLSKPEWTVSRMPAPPVRERRIGAGVGQATGNGVGNTPGAGGNGVYDPYAGASPARRAEGPPVPGSLGNLANVPDLTSELDSAAVAELRSQRRARGRRAGGEDFECRVTVNAEGAIVEALCAGGSGGEAMALAAMLRGRHIFSVTREGMGRIRVRL